MTWERLADVTDENPLVLSPFKYHCDISVFNYLKMYLLSVFVFPVRLVATGISFLLALSLATAMTTNFNSQNTEKPDVSITRRIFLPVLVTLSRFVFFCGGIQWVKVKGRRALRKEAPILVVAPHSSFLDSLVVVLLNMTSVVTMTEHADSFIGGLIRVLQPVLVNREDHKSRKNTMKLIHHRAHSNDDWPQLVIFPEGTCTNRTCLVSFKQGAFLPGVPVQPVLLRWPNTVDSTTWVWDGPSVLKLLWMTLTQFNTYFEVEFLPVYTPNEEEQLDAQLYANNVRSTMAKALNIRTCDLTYDDFCRIRVATECNLPTPEPMAYLYSLIRTAFSYRDVRLETDNINREWIRSRLDSLVDFARRTPSISLSELTGFLFHNEQPSDRDRLLLRLMAKHYLSGVENQVNFRLVATQTCMFFFSSDPQEGLRLALKAYPSIDDASLCEERGTIDTWHVSSECARQLLTYLFNFPPNSSVTVDDILSAIDTNSGSPASNLACQSNGISAEQLYDVLEVLANEQLKSYSLYETELTRIFGVRGRPLLETCLKSASQASLSSIHSVHILQDDISVQPTTTVRDSVSWTIDQSNGICNTNALIHTNEINSHEDSFSTTYRRGLQGKSCGIQDT